MEFLILDEKEEENENTAGENIIPKTSIYSVSPGYDVYENEGEIIDEPEQSGFINISGTNDYESSNSVSHKLNLVSRICEGSEEVNIILIKVSGEDEIPHQGKILREEEENIDS